MSTELTLYKDIDKKLRTPNKVEVFPLTPTHRKELRELKSQRIGNLTRRLSIIKDQKKEEYKTKYQKEIKKEIKSHETTAQKINESFIEMVGIINGLIVTHEKLEKSFNLKFLTLNNDYGSISDLETFKKSEMRNWTLNIKYKTNQIINEEFEQKYGLPFKEVKKQIDNIETQYEEAINFGNLELVKELYYIIKSSDNFFKKIENLKV